MTACGSSSPTTRRRARASGLKLGGHELGEGGPGSRSGAPRRERRRAARGARAHARARARGRAAAGRGRDGGRPRRGRAGRAGGGDRPRRQAAAQGRARLRRARGRPRGLAGHLAQAAAALSLAPAEPRRVSRVPSLGRVPSTSRTVLSGMKLSPPASPPPPPPPPAGRPLGHVGRRRHVRRLRRAAVRAAQLGSRAARAGQRGIRRSPGSYASLTSLTSRARCAARALRPSLGRGRPGDRTAERTYPARFLLLPPSPLPSRAQGPARRTRAGSRARSAGQPACACLASLSLADCPR